MPPILSAADAASAASHSLGHAPATPVVIHWQLSDFPVSVARQLADSGHTVVWVYPSAERGDVAEVALKKAGFAVRRHLGKNEAVAKVTGVPTKYLGENLEPFEQPRVDPEADRARRANLSELKKARLKALSELADAPIGAPAPGCVTLISVGMMTQPGIIPQLASWASPVVVLDHATSLNIRWKDVRDGPEDFPLRVVTQSPDKYLPAMLLAERIPQMFVMRDEWACRLASAYFAEQGAQATEITTEFMPHKGLRVAAFSTDLVHSGFAATTFLSIEVAAPAHQLVGQATIGAITPDSLSMSGQRCLSQAVIKVSHPRPDEAQVMQRQAKASQQEYAEIRARDHVRTAMLAFKATAKAPELIVLVSPNLANAVESLTGVATIRIGNWGLRGYSKQTTAESLAPSGTAFQRSVLTAALNQREIITDGRRYAKVFELFNKEKDSTPKHGMAERLAGLAYGLTRISGERGLDLAARDEDNIALSERAKKAVRLFSHLLDDCYPWKPYAKAPDIERNLEIRRQVLLKYRARLAAKN